MTDSTVTVVLIGPPAAGVSSFARALAVDLGASRARPPLVVRCRDERTRAILHRSGATTTPSRLSLALSTLTGRSTALDLWDLPGDDTAEAVLWGRGDDAAQILGALGTADVLLLLLPVPEPDEGPDPAALALIDGLATRLASRAERAPVAVVLTQSDRLEHDERSLDVRDLLSAHGYAGALEALALEARTTAFFAASALGLGADREAPHPEGIAEPIVWALGQARRGRRRKVARRCARGALALLGLGALVVSFDALHWAQRVAAVPDSEPRALLRAAHEARAYAGFPLALRAVEARSKACTWERLAEAGLWAAIEAPRASGDDDAALVAIEQYLSLLPAGERAVAARALDDELRLARLTAVARDDDPERALTVLVRERERLTADVARRQADALVAAVQERLEARDRAAAEAVLQALDTGGDLQRGIDAVDAFLVRHPASSARKALLERRDHLAVALEERVWAEVLASLKRVDDPARRLSILRRHLAGQPRTANRPEARELVERLDREMDDGAFAKAAVTRPFTPPDTAAWVRALEEYLRDWPRGRNATVARELLVEVRALEAVHACVAARDPDGVLAALDKALSTSRATRDELLRLTRRWSEVEVTVTVLSAYVSDAHWELFSSPDPRVSLHVGNGVHRTREASDARDATFHETFCARLRTGLPVTLELHDVNVFHDTLVDSATIPWVRQLDGAVPVGRSRVVLRLDAVEPVGPHH